MQIWLDTSRHVVLHAPEWMRSAIGSRGCVACWVIRSFTSWSSYLDAGGPLTPSKLAKLIGRQVSTISIHLGKLRAADVVRYDSSGKETRYWLKHKSEMKGLLRMLEKVVDASAKLE